jgi:hypothetical protein
MIFQLFHQSMCRFTSRQDIITTISMLHRETTSCQHLKDQRRTRQTTTRPLHLQATTRPLHLHQAPPLHHPLMLPRNPQGQSLRFPQPQRQTDRLHPPTVQQFQHLLPPSLPKARFHDIAAMLEIQPTTPLRFISASSQVAPQAHGFSTAVLQGSSSMSQ